MTRLLALLLTAVALTLTACTGAEPMETTSDTVIVDVRTPDEFASGHLSGAVNIDLNSGAFDAEVATLDPAGDYIVYCRSGNRSAQAKKIMEGLGFTNVRDAGGVQAASSATGLDVVTD